MNIEISSVPLKIHRKNCEISLIQGIPNIPSIPSISSIWFAEIVIFG